LRIAVLIDRCSGDVIVSTAVGNHNNNVFGSVAVAERYGGQDKDKQNNNSNYRFFNNHQAARHYTVFTSDLTASFVLWSV
jgi:hypothetical protein